MNDPWYKSTFHYAPLGQKLSLHVPHDVFSTQNIDEGTLLLLENLPLDAPTTILDLGCGYGALGLPLAAQFPNALIEMADRDLLAVQWSEKNALFNQLSNVKAYGSLGFRDLPGENPAYDWILCNVPARIGRPFIKNLIELGSTLLTATGELRVVVIRDLGPVLLEMKAEYDWPLVEVVQGPRHTIFSLTSMTPQSEDVSPDQLYLRDTVQIQGLSLARPYDLGGDDQKRLKTGLPVLIDALPRQTPMGGFRVLCFRSGYGQLPLVSRKRWPEALVVAIDRDLLGTTFTRDNARSLDLDDDRLQVRETAHFPDALLPDEKFNLIIGELSPSAGEGVALAEMRAIESALMPGGQALLLCLEKIEKDWVKTFQAESKLTVNRVLAREGYAVVRFAK